MGGRREERGLVDPGPVHVAPTAYCTVAAFSNAFFVMMSRDLTPALSARHKAAHGPRHQGRFLYKRWFTDICVVWQIISACVAGVHTPARPVCGWHVVGTVVS